MPVDSTLPRAILQRLDAAHSAWQQRLQAWAAGGEFAKAAQFALNLNAGPALLTSLSERLARGVMDDLPPVQLLDGALLPGARGAYGLETATIYLNASWLQAADNNSIHAVLSEELGHHLDALLNAADSPGDEGARFAAALMGLSLSASTQQALLAEDDLGLVLVDGALIHVEFSEIIGTPGDDTLDGTEDADVLRGLGGNDVLRGHGGADQLYGDEGIDSLDGGEGNDVLDPGSGADIAIGGDGDDTLYVYRQSDTTATKAIFFSTLPANPLADGVNLAINSIEYNVIYATDYNDILDFSAADSTQRAILYGYAGDDTLIGGAADDNIQGGDGNDSLKGGGGGDSLNPGIGSDIVAGGDGNDYLFADRRSDNTATKAVFFSTLPANPLAAGVNLAIQGVENSTIYATDYNDILDFSAADSTQRAILYGYAGDDALTGGAADDSLDGGDGNDSLKGGDGRDYLYGYAGDDRLEGEAGDDALDPGSGADIAIGGDGDDTLYVYRQSDTTATKAIFFSTLPANPLADGVNLAINSIEYNVIYATDYNDILDFSAADSTQRAILYGYAGDDTLIGGAADDNLQGGDGNDSLKGGGGGDSLNPGIGSDIVAGGDGNDYLFADRRSDNTATKAVFFSTLPANPLAAGVNLAIQGVENSTIYATDYNDILDFSAADSTQRAILYGYAGDDALTGGAADDSLDGGDGNDSLKGGDGRDYLYGYAGDDRLEGEAGDDALDPGSGADIAIGGDGDDTLYVYRQSDTTATKAIFFSTLPANPLADGVNLAINSIEYNVIYATDYNDILDFSAADSTQRAILYGYAGDDTLIGGAADDNLQGGDGNDSLKGGGGGDSLNPGIGSDIVAGGDGNDYLFADRRSDNTATKAVFFSTLPANPLAAGVNLAIQGVENSTIYATDYNDILDFSAADSTQRAILYGYAGDDALTGGAADDSLDGGDGNDSLKGGDGRDYLYGYAGDDRLEGEAGDDALDPGSGADIAIGGDGDDTLYVYRQSDTTATKAIFFSTLPANPLADGVNLAINSIEYNVIYATDYNDILDFSAADSTQRAILYGYAGDDTLIGGAADDNIQGGDGNDSLNDTEGNNFFSGGTGVDTFVAGDGNDTIEGGEGDEEINGGGGNDRIWGDYIYSETANSTDILRGNAGDDEMHGGAGDDTLIDIEGNNFFSGGTGVDTFVAGDGNDTIEGGEGDEEINGGGGNDRIWGDYIYSETANSTDILRGNAGDDEMHGGAGDDTLIDIEGNNFFSGGTGVDTFVAGDGNDTIEGGEGDEEINGGGGNDRIWGDYIYSETANSTDILRGNAGDDEINGGAGDDVLYGNAGNDYLYGGRDNDQLQGTEDGRGETDYLRGDQGSDRFILGTAITSFYDDGNSPLVGSNGYAYLYDFDPSADTIQLYGDALRYSLEANGSETRIYIFEPGGAPADLIAIVAGQTGLNLESSYFSYAGYSGIPNGGRASFSLSGTVAVNNTVAAVLVSPDPDGNGPFAYDWQTASVGGPWWPLLHTSDSYTIPSREEGRQLRVAITYTDNKGFPEGLFLDAGVIPLYNDGPAVFAIGGTVAVGQTLSALLQSSDPDGNGPFSFQWQTSSDGSPWLTVGSEETYTVASGDQGKQLRLAVTYTDAQTFDEFVTVAAGTVPIPPPPDIDLRVVGLDTVTITESPVGDLEAIATLNQINPARSLTAIGIDNSAITLGTTTDVMGTTVRVQAAVTSIGAPATAIGVDRSRLMLRPGDDSVTISAQISGVAGTPSVAMRNSFLSANRGDDQITLQGDLWGERALIYAGDGNDRITAYGIGRDSFIQAGPGNDWVSLGRLETTPGTAPLDRVGNDPIAASTYRGGAGFDTLNLREVSQAEFSAEATWFTSPGENGWQFRGARFSGFETYTFGS